MEGPSDRIYINHWLHALDPEVTEGLHHSTMFYGGRSLSHLSAEDEEITEFINLRQLNRHLAVIMDSDKPTPQGRINDTKKRIFRAFDSGPGSGWITKGREIENYVPPAMIEASLREVYPKTFHSLCARGPYDHVLSFYMTPGKRQSEKLIYAMADKMKIAKHVCQQPADLSVLDLRTRISELLSMIKSANQ